jgi:uncharacterized protein YbbC (DUF1343 family)
MNTYRSVCFFMLVLMLSWISPRSGIGQALLVGAEQPEQYLTKMENKRIGLLVNQTSLVKGVHLIDYLRQHKVPITVIFAAEHGVRGEAEAGEVIQDGLDKKSGIPIVSLYGKEKKPTAEQLKNVDIMVFDVQDVGCRFFTYISTMHYIMEACAEKGIPLIILDRPNPNGDYIAGPVLQSDCKSFVGMHPIPVVHGCTVGELARMINGENWLVNNRKVDLIVVPVKNYTHKMRYSLPVKPSPNLPNDAAVRLYPSLCFFEATNVSIGRGTHFPFQVIGFPDKKMGAFSFTPQSIDGMSKNPLHEGIICYGEDLRAVSQSSQFTLDYFLQWYKKIDAPEKFWKSKSWMELLSGNKQIYHQIHEGMSEAEIKKTWQKELDQYLAILRKKYLLYSDFE